jgi:SpoU rRNA methylase family enzyme
MFLSCSRFLPLALALAMSLPAASQECTSYIVINAFDYKLHLDIQTLKAEDFEARMGHTDLQIVSLKADYNSRLLVVLEADSVNNAKIAEAVDTATRMVRAAPEGRPVAFGIYADRAVFTKDFVSDAQERTKQVGAVMEEANSLGKRVAMFDALHEALKRFGQHQPGDTVLLIGIPYDDKSSHSVADIEKEYMASGTRLMIMQREQLSTASRDYLWNSHRPERRLFGEVPDETGGANSSDFDPHFLGFPWRGYLVGVKRRDNASKPRKWEMKLRRAVSKNFPRFHLYYPTLLPPCSNTSAEAR